MMSRLILLIPLCLSLPALADAGAEAVLNAVLREESVDIVHAKALPDGTIEIIFGIEAGELEQARVVEALRAHDAVRRVVATASPRTFCRID